MGRRVKSLMRFFLFMIGLHMFRINVLDFKNLNLVVIVVSAMVILFSMNKTIVFIKKIRRKFKKMYKSTKRNLYSLSKAIGIVSRFI